MVLQKINQPDKAILFIKRSTTRSRCTLSGDYSILRLDANAREDKTGEVFLDSNVRDAYGLRTTIGGRDKLLILATFNKYPLLKHTE